MEKKIEIKKVAEITVAGNFNKVKINGKIPTRTSIKAMDIAEGITYHGRNSNAEKCISCSPKENSVHWMHISFNQNEVAQDMWICESCARSYPSGKGKKNFPLFLNSKKA